LRADVPERYVPEVRVGQRVRVFVESTPEGFDGLVARVAPMVDPASRTFRVEIRSANADGKLRPGAFARASIDTRIDADVTLVPVEALATFVGETKVFTIEAGVAAEHRVRTGARDGNFVEIVEGLSGVHPLVVTGLAKIASGTGVDVKAAADLDGPPVRGGAQGGGGS
jgi:RND family efflux transporter MFP subunit